MKLKRLLSSTAVVATFLWAGIANAAVYQFTLGGDYSASWQLDTDILPDYSEFETGIAYYDVVGTYANAVSEYADIAFYHDDQDGGLAIEDYYGDQLLLLTDGPQLYTGSEANPGFATGTYELSETGGPGRYTLTISAVPEPATYGMLLGGMAIVGIALRRRQGK